jgi:hypothetical protein
MKAHIKISFRQIIDATCIGNFEKNILRASYNEFVLKSQAYNLENRFKTFLQMVQNDGRANSLHYKSGFAVVQFIKSLNNKMPCLQDSLGRPLVFSSHKFEILNSDLADQSQHKVAITYMTDTLTLYGNMGDYLLLANGDYSPSADKPIDTFVLKMQEGLAIFSYHEITNETQPVNF